MHVNGRATYWSVVAVQVGHVLRELVAVLDQFCPGLALRCLAQSLQLHAIDPLRPQLLPSHEAEL